MSSKKTKQQLNSKQNKLKRKKQSNMARYIGIVAAMFVVGVLGVTIWLLNLSPNYVTYTVNSHQIDKENYSLVFFYNTYTSKDWQEYGYDSTKNPYNQKFNYTQANKSFKTWGDYFQSMTDDTIDFFYIMTDTAKKTGYTYSDSVKTSVKTEQSSLAKKAKEESIGFEEYMLKTYGVEATEESLCDYLTLYYQANDFYKAITTDKQLFLKTFSLDENFFENYYEEKSEDIDVVSYRYYYLENTKANAEKIGKFKNVKSADEFKKLCDFYSASLSYAESDSSLYTNQNIKQIKSFTNSKIAQSISSNSAKENKLYYNEAEINGKDCVEFVYLVKAKSKDTEVYGKSDLKNWEFSVISLFLEDYKDKNFKCCEVEKGIEQFKKDVNKGFVE